MSADHVDDDLLSEVKSHPKRHRALVRAKVVLLKISEKCVRSVESLYSFFMRLSPAWRTMFFLALMALLCSNYLLVRYVMKNHAKDVEIIEAKKCPACFGRKLCAPFVRGEISFSGFTDSLPVIASWRQQKTYRGYFNRDSVVLKRLGSYSTFEQLDRWLCEYAHYAPACGVHAAMYKQLSDNGNVKLAAYDFRTAPQDGAAACMTKRLLDLIIETYTERDGKELVRYEELLLKYTMLINGEPLLMQAFTDDRGYPFCKYIGACGRWVVEADCGKPLNEMLSASFADRVELAYQVLQIASRLSHTIEDFSFYMLDVSVDHFTVQTAAITGRRTVRLADLERVVVVDRQDVQRRRPSGYERLLEAERPAYDYAKSDTDDESDAKKSNAEACKPLTTCPWYSATAMCDKLDTDYNYFVVCRDVLGPTADPLGTQYHGLLHSVPAQVDERYRLSHWLQECTHPSSDAHEGRLAAKDQLLTILRELRTIRNMEL